jgi:multiple sugar transport system permease protein
MGENTGSLSSVKKNDMRLRIAVYVISIILVIISLSPLLALITEFTGFKVNNPANVIKVLPKRINELKDYFKPRVIRGFINSVVVTGLSTLLNVYFSALTAHSIYAYRWKFRKVFSNIILALMMLPTIIATSGFIHLVYKFHLENNLLVLILPSIATPISVVFMRLYLESAFSMEMIYSARIDGAGEFRIFNQIVLPILKPAIATQAIFAFVASWNDATTPSVVLIKDESKTLPLVTALNLAMGDYLLTAFVMTIPAVIAFLFLSKHIVEGVQLGSLKM